MDALTLLLMMHIRNKLISRPGVSVAIALAKTFAQCLALFVAATTVLDEALERNRQRRALSRLEDHHLRDIGVTRAEAVREADKPFWRR